jgi:hypothetical protein
MNTADNGNGPKSVAAMAKALAAQRGEEYVHDLLKGEFYDDGGRITTNAGMQSEEDHEREIQRYVESGDQGAGIEEGGWCNQA